MAMDLFRIYIYIIYRISSARDTSTSGGNNIRKGVYALYIGA